MEEHHWKFGINPSNNGSVYSDYIQDEAFSFGMDPFDGFDSDSDSEADNIFVEINDGGQGGVNEKLLSEMDQLNIDNNDVKSNEDPQNSHNLSAESNIGENLHNGMQFQIKSQYSRSSYI